MDIIQLVPQIYGKFIMFVLIFTRITSMLVTFVLFKRDLITGRMIMSLSAIISVYILLLYHQPVIQYDDSTITLLMHILFQGLIGILSGFILNIIFEIFLVTGQFISTQIGLSVASLIDQRFGYITSLSHFYVITTTLIFLYLNGHLYAIKTIAESFAIIPIDQVFIPKDIVAKLIAFTGSIFTCAASLSITIVVIVMLTNISLAVMTKFAPQFNLFSIGINMQMVMGLFFVYITYQLFVDSSTHIIGQSLQFFHDTLLKKP